MTENKKIAIKALVMLIVSPIYVPTVILWENRKDIIAFYVQMWSALKAYGDE